MEGKKHPWERDWSYGWSLMRIGAILRRTSMDDLDRWYELTGRALHEEGHRPPDPDVARHLLDELGLDPAVVDAALADPTTHDEVRSDHDRVVAAGGYGVPTLFFGEHCLFGPVLIDPTTGDAAVRLWRAVAVDGRAKRVDSLTAPDVVLYTDSLTFALLACGRIDPQGPIDDGRITWTGDADWGDAAARNLAFTM